MKALLPWLCVVGLLAGLGLIYSSGQKKEAELTVLREDSKQLQQMRAEQEEGKAAGVQAANDELDRLRKQLEDLPRLRNELNQLRAEKQQLATQVQTAQAQARGAQEQVQALRAPPGQPPPAPGTVDAAAAAAAAAFRARYGLTNASPEQVATLTCINNLRMIDGAKQQWALEKRKSGGSLLTAADLTPYLRGNVMPACPSGGIYTLNPVSVAPICNITGHTLSR